MRSAHPKNFARLLEEILEKLEIDNGSRCDSCKSTDILLTSRCGECGKLCNWGTG